ncbi:MAG: hypothetical protein MJY56_06625 [Bacteroidales bacterium]|nr:hypothetical protein [Bacteroidales bacterium]
MFKDLNYDDSGFMRVIYSTQVVQLVNSIRNLDPGNYGNKREVANALAEGVRNGKNPEIREAQMRIAAKAKANGKETHKYSNGFFRF